MHGNGVPSSHQERRKIMKKLAVVLLAAILLTSAVGGSMAYFTDSLSVDNVITSGNIQVVQYEQERAVDDDGGYGETLTAYTQYQVLAPMVQSGDNGYDTVSISGTPVRLRNENTKNYVDKIVTVKNVGVNPAYVRTYIAIPTMGHQSSSPLGENWLHWDAVHSDESWSWGQKVTDGGNTTAAAWPADSQNGWHMIDNAWINGVEYDIYVATYTRKLMPGETTAPSLLGFYLDSSVSNDRTYRHFFPTAAGQKIYLTNTSSIEILVATEAAQTTTFQDPWTALDTVFGEAGLHNHPWEDDNTTYVSSTAELIAALHTGATIRLKAGTYDLPAQLPAAVRVVGHEAGVVLNAPPSIAASGVEFFHVTFANAVDFTGSGEFDAVTFRDSFTATFDNPAYLTGCVFGVDCRWAVTEDAVRSTVIFENCTDQAGEPVVSE